MKIKYLKRTAVSNYPIETKSVLLHSNFIFLSLSILFLLLLALTFDAIYIVDFVHHRHLLNTDLSAFAGVGTGSSERAYIAVGLPLNAVCKKRVWASFFFFFFFAYSSLQPLNTVLLCAFWSKTPGGLRQPSVTGKLRSLKIETQWKCKAMHV